MKKIMCLFLACAMILGLCACGGTKDNDDSLQAGFSRMIAMPTTEYVHIAGGDAASDISDGYLDELAVTCVALKQGEQTVLIYTCDIVDIEKSFYSTTENAITTATGIPASNIILNATHTHSAPTLKNNLPGKDEYLIIFNDACAKAGAEAIADLSGAKLSYGSVDTGMVRVRHYLMNDGTTHGNGHGSATSGYKEHLYDADSECQVLRLTRAAEDKKDIVLMNLGAHATIVSGTHTSFLSADFPGPARLYVEENADVHCAYFIAAAGDQVPGSKIAGNNPAGSDHMKYGQQLGEYVVQCLENMTEATAGNLTLYNETYTAERMKDGIEDKDRVAHANEIVALAQAQSKSSDDVKAKISEYGFYNYYEASGLAGRAKAPATGSFPIGAISIGNVGLVFFAGEMFGAQGAQLKSESPMDMTFVITCSEDDQGYFPTEIAKTESFYEYDQTKYAMGTGEAVAKRFVEILTSLQKGETPAPQTAQ